MSDSTKCGDFQSNYLVRQALAELGDVVRCRCAPGYKNMGRHDPACECDSAPAVKAVADRIEELEAEAEGASAIIASERAEVLALRKKLAKAVEAFDTISGHMVLNNEGDEELSDSALIALATLAELKGHTHE